MVEFPKRLYSLEALAGSLPVKGRKLFSISASNDDELEVALKLGFKTMADLSKPKPVTKKVTKKTVKKVK